MTSRLITCVLLAGALAACDAGTAGPPTPPSDPTSTGYEPPGGSTDLSPGVGGSIEQLCAYDCMRFETLCPGSSSGTDCAVSCTQSAASFPGCEAEFKAYLSCIASTPVTCANGTPDISGCESAANAVTSCAGVSGGSGTGSGGTGTAGASGTAPPR